MSKRRKFTAEFKSEVVLQLLSGEKSMAELCREWRQKHQSDQPASATSRRRKKIAAAAATTDQPNEYATIRQRLMDHINHLIDTLDDDPATVHVRVNALTRLLDRVIRLEAIIPRTQTHKTIRIEYKHADGTISDQPPWAGAYKPPPKVPSQNLMQKMTPADPSTPGSTRITTPPQNPPDPISPPVWS